jgi:hypothetical protein
MECTPGTPRAALVKALKPHPIHKDGTVGGIAHLAQSGIFKSSEEVPLASPRLKSTRIVFEHSSENGLVISP